MIAKSKANGISAKQATKPSTDTNNTKPKSSKGKPKKPRRQDTLNSTSVLLLLVAGDLVKVGDLYREGKISYVTMKNVQAKLKSSGQEELVSRLHTEAGVQVGSRTGKLLSVGDVVERRVRINKDRKTGKLSGALVLNMSPYVDPLVPDAQTLPQDRKIKVRYMEHGVHVSW